GRVIRPRVVERTTQRDGEVAIQPGPFLTGAAGKHDGLIDALEVHVLEARLRIRHAGALQTVELCRALGFLDSHTRQIGELLFDALAPGFPLRLELAGDALLPVGQVAAVPIGIDHMSAVFTHEIPPCSDKVAHCSLVLPCSRQRFQPCPSRSNTPRANWPPLRSVSAESKSSNG